jgi:hypothetical protein
MSVVAEGTLERHVVTAGRRRAAKPKRSWPGPLPHLAALVGLVAGAVASGFAWYFLVRAAIDFGHAARGGQTVAWAVTGAATFGAIGCLLLMFVLLARAGRTTRTLRASRAARVPKPQRSAGGRRAAR